MNDNYQPQPSDRFSFGLWTVGNPGRDPFGDAVRPKLDPISLVKLLAEVGAWGVCLHDNDLVPIDAPARDRDRIVKDFRQACRDLGLVVPMATTNLFTDPIFKDGAFTSNDGRVRAYALQKTMRAIDIGAELGAKIYVFWGGREGTEVDASKDPRTAIERFRECIDYLCSYCIDQGYSLKFALEAKPNEPRGDIFLPTTGHCLAFISTLQHHEMVGVNPEVAHEHMAGLNMHHTVAQAIAMGKLFHVDLNDQIPGRYDQDFRFGSANPKTAFYLVRLLEESGYEGPRHFDSHAYRTEDMDGVRDFARGSMRTYLILKEKARQMREDSEIQDLLSRINKHGGDNAPLMKRYSKDSARKIGELQIDRAGLGAAGLEYERLDQCVNELLFGVRDRERGASAKPPARSRNGRK
ncbi:MAG: xylose isomerase [Planctomycetes bacterium]|nr:xylose isomerase [Planctomycetota bacterium]